MSALLKELETYVDPATNHQKKSALMRKWKNTPREELCQQFEQLDQSAEDKYRHVIFHLISQPESSESKTGI